MEEGANTMAVQVVRILGATWSMIKRPGMGYAQGPLPAQTSRPAGGVWPSGEDPGPGDLRWGELSTRVQERGSKRQDACVPGLPFPG